MDNNIPSHLIIRYLSHEATDEEQEQLLDWVSQNAEHQKIFQEYSEHWEQKNRTHETFDLNEGLRKLNSMIDMLEQETPRPWFTWTKFAAAVVLMIVAGGAIMLPLRLQNPATEKLTYLEHKALPGERITIALLDGSKVQLNSNASLRFPEKFDGSKREVFLTGEAFFTVAKDASKPFIIHTGTVTTTVLGTSFNIHAQDHQVAVTVTTGKVKVSDGNLTEMLLPQNKVVYDRHTMRMKKMDADPDRELAWTTNTLVFDDTDLLTAATMLEQWYGVKISFSNESLKKCLMTGTFKDESLKHVLDAIAFSTGVHYEQHDKEVNFTGKGCE